MNYLKALAAGISLAAGMLFIPVVTPTTAQATGCTTIPSPTSGSYYQMAKYFSVSYTRTGATGTATVKLNSGITLCNDQAMVLQSFTMGPNWNGQPDSHDSFMTSLPQTMSHATHFTFSKTDTSKTVTVQTPDACKGTQLDTYVGDQEIKTIVNEHDDDYAGIDGQIFTTVGTCAPKQIKVCDLTTLKMVTIDETAFDSKKYSNTAADCEPKPVMIDVCDLATDTIIRIDQNTFDAKKHGKAADCNKITVCDTSTKAVSTISKKDQTSTQVTDLTKCDTRVCRVSDKTTMTIKDSDYQAKKDIYSTDLSKCNPAAPTTPAVELPHTGPLSLVGSVTGLGALTYGIYAYVVSRRVL